MRLPANRLPAEDIVIDLPHDIRIVHAKNGQLAFPGADLATLAAWRAMSGEIDPRLAFWEAWHLSREKAGSLAYHLKKAGLTADLAARIEDRAKPLRTGIHATKVARQEMNRGLDRGVHRGPGYYALFRENLASPAFRQTLDIGLLAARHVLPLARFDAPGYNTTVGFGGRIEYSPYSDEKGANYATPVGAWCGSPAQRARGLGMAEGYIELSICIPRNWFENVYRRGLALPVVEGRTTFALKALAARMNRKTGEAIPERFVALRQYPYGYLRVEHAARHRDGELRWEEPPVELDFTRDVLAHARKLMGEAGSHQRISGKSGTAPRSAPKNLNRKG